MKDRRRIIDDRLYAHFITFSVFRRRRLLDHDHPKRILLGVLNAELGEHEASCVGFVVMPNYSFEIYTTSKLEEKLQYMHNNPVRAGLVQQATDWKWGSARWYEWHRSVGVPIESVD